MKAVQETVELERVQLFQMQLLTQELAAGMTKDIRVCDHMDAYEMRRAFRGWGRIERRTLSCPANWWHHLKLAIRTRWPRLFGRLVVEMQSVTVENGALVTGLKSKLPAKYVVIPIALETTGQTWNDDPRTEGAL